MSVSGKKAFSIILAVVLALSLGSTVYAEEEISVSGYTELYDTESGYPSVAAELESVAAELESLTPGEDYVDGEGVFLADTEAEAERIAAQYNGTLKSYAHRIAVVRFKSDTVSSLYTAAGKETTDHIVEPNYICNTMDTGINDPYAADNSHEYYQYFHDKIHTLEAHRITAGEGAKIAVVDTGCTPDHEDSEFDEEHTLHVSSLSSGIDTTVGHGIHCTGIIHEKKGNSLGGFGVAPDAEIYSVKVAKTKEFSMSAAMEGFSIAMEKHVNVISMSIGSIKRMDSFQELVNEAYEAGIMVVSAAGNEGNSTYVYPAAYDHVLSVAATDRDDGLASYSNYGDWVDVAAPGTHITSTYLYGSGKSFAGTKPQDTYGCESGTSMATPIVAGVAALCYASNPCLLELGNSEAVEAVTKAIMDTTDGEYYNIEKGIVRADAAIEAAQVLLYDSVKYTLVDESGDYGAYLTGTLAQGKKVKLAIGDLKGETKGYKKALKEAKCSSSCTGVTVKNGTVKCGKDVEDGSQVIIKAEIGGDTLQCKYTVHKPLIGAGLYALAKNGKIKIISTIDNNKDPLPCGTVLDLLSPNRNNSNLNLYYSKVYNDPLNAYSANNGFKYEVTIKKKDVGNGITLVMDKKGRPVKAVLDRPGKYKIKFRTIEGSKKSFTYKLIVE